MFHRVGTFSAREVNRFGAPSLITRTTNDVQQVQMLVLLTCTLMVSAPIMCVGGIIMALQQDVGLSWLILVSVPILVAAIGVIISRMVPQFRLMQKRIDAINRVMREQITGIRVVRAFVREPYERARYRVANEELTDTALRVGRLHGADVPDRHARLQRLQRRGALVRRPPDRRGRHADRFADGIPQSYLMQILMSIMMATFMLVMVPRAAVCAERLTEVLETDTSVVTSPSPVTDLALRGSVELSAVGFSYPGAQHPVLRDISFRADPGRTTAIIGSTGAGKTTLLSLIPRLFDITAGSVRVDGVDVRDLHPDLLHSRIGLVPQRAYLFTGTIESNLRYGRSDATDDELWDALRIAQADDFVAALPDGLQAPVAQGGTNFSGGQRQRLAIARAVVRRPEIYLFDDSFSALDLSTDARLRAALRPVTVDSTVLIVAQRVSTIIEADQILVVDDGALVGVGRHDELVLTCPTYAEIVSSQLPAEVAA